MAGMKVGFIGLGAMGSRMAKNVVKGGYPLGVYNRTAPRAEPLRGIGAAVYDSPKTLAESSDVIIIMVTGPEALHELVEAENGVAAGVREGACVINMSTVSHEATMRASAEISCRKGIFIDAPVSGSLKTAEGGGLVILAGGESAEVEKMAPLLRTMGKEIIHCGGVGKGTSMKLAVNLLLINMMEALSEAVTLGRRFGLQVSDLLRAIDAGAMASPLLRVKGKAIQERDFARAFPVSLAFKDLNLALEAAGKAGVPLPGAAATREIYCAAMARGLGGEDLCSVIKVLESLAERKTDASGGA